VKLAARGQRSGTIEFEKETPSALDVLELAGIPIEYVKH
jgi:ferredoxin